MPTKSTSAGETVVKQVNAYENNIRRTKIAGSMVRSSIHNMLRTIEYYKGQFKIQPEINSLKSEKALDFSNIYNIDEIMGIEADARDTYYSAINKIIPDGFSFDTRTYNPPNTPFNALISFCNSLL
jgi:CRISPR-associated protein Cas1